MPSSACMQLAHDSYEMGAVRGMPDPPRSDIKMGVQAPPHCDVQVGAPGREPPRDGEGRRLLGTPQAGGQPGFSRPACQPNAWHCNCAMTIHVQLHSDCLNQPARVLMTNAIAPCHKSWIVRRVSAAAKLSCSELLEALFFFFSRSVFCLRSDVSMEYRGQEAPRRPHPRLPPTHLVPSFSTECQSRVSKTSLSTQSPHRSSSGRSSLTAQQFAVFALVWLIVPGSWRPR